MNFVSSIPSARTGFETFLFQNFGIYTDVSSNGILVVGALIAITMLFKSSLFSSNGLR